MKLLLLCLWFCCCAGQTSSAKTFQSWVTDPRLSLFPTLPNIAPESQDETCKIDSQAFLSGLKNKTLWAVQMWDSSAKAPVGVISGNIYHFGQFDQCMRTGAPFKVQFCLVNVIANISANFWDIPLKEKIPPEANAWSYIARSRLDVSKVPRDILAWGLCAPASCNSSDLQLAINSHVRSQRSNESDETTFEVLVNPDFCTKVTDYIDLTPGEIAFWVFLFTLILLTASSTFMDLMAGSEEVKHSKIYNLWMVFSVKQNYTHVIPPKKTSTTPLDVFHGIKFVSIIFIVYGHRVGVSISLSTINYNVIEDHLFKDNKFFFLHTDLVVDTFFFISGLLAAYFLMVICQKRFVDPVSAVLVRATRLGPLYYFIIWFQSTAAYRMGSGPLWQAIAKNETQYCVDHWWSNVFFFSNYYKTDEMCLPHSWFLPCELHFFALASILIPTIIKFPKTGKIILGVLIAVSAVIPSVIIYMNKVPPLILFYYEFLMQPRKYASFNVLYVKSHNRATVYLIGLATGIFLYYTKDNKTEISKKLTLCGVLAWLVFLFTPMAYGSTYYDLDKTYNLLEDAIFGSLRRVSWGIAFVIFIVTHRFGRIPLMDFFFSSRLAVFCSKITYGVYLIHYLIITIDVLNTRSSKVFSTTNCFVDGIGDILKAGAFTIALAFILEIPLKRILREFLFAKTIKELVEPPDTKNVCTQQVHQKSYCRTEGKRRRHDTKTDMNGALQLFRKNLTQN